MLSLTMLYKAYLHIGLFVFVSTDRHVYIDYIMTNNFAYKEYYTMRLLNN